MNLARRVNLLEDRLNVEESDEDLFLSRLMAFRVMMSALQGHDADRNEYRRFGLQHFLDIKGMDEPTYRRYIAQEIPKYEAHTSIDKEWSPLDGYPEEVRRKRGYDRPAPWETESEAAP